MRLVFSVGLSIFLILLCSPISIPLSIIKDKLNV